MGRVKPTIHNGKFTETSKNKTFCMAPWTHTYISPQSERRMCCASREAASFQKQYIDTGNNKNEYAPITLKEHWNSEHMKSVRKRLLAGEKIPECEVCNDDVLSLSAYRNWFNHLFGHKIDEAFKKTNDNGETSMPVVSFDYRISNLCNYKCRMCGEQLSSSWESEKRINNMWYPESDPWMIPENKTKILRFQKEVIEQEITEAVKSGIVEELYWVGGEPLMWDIHWQLMDTLVKDGNAKNVYVRYNTNLSRISWKGVNLYELLPNFKDYIMCCSIDGTGKIVEFIRTGIKWEEWLSYFKQGCELDKEKMILDLTLTLPGLFSLKELFDLSKELDVRIETKITFAFDSQVIMSPMVLPRNILDDIIDDLLEYMKDYTWKQATLINTLRDMKTRKNFEEEWPDDFRLGLSKGKTYHKKIANIRKDGEQNNLSLESILQMNKSVWHWWQTTSNY